MRLLAIPLSLIFLAHSLFCEENSSSDIVNLSEAMGHLIGKNLQSTGVPIDIEALVRGMKEGCKGNDSSFSEEECLQALAALQEKSLSIEAEKNLAEANEFLKRNQKQKNIVNLENGQLQYQTIKPGSGNCVQPYNSPLIRYKGRYLNGQTFGASAGDEMVSLDETIDGLKKGIVGMKEGEIRTLYVHPDLGYGRHAFSMPNALLVFEVELIKADASAEAHAASNAEDAIHDAITNLQ
jgi:peptidylprolyl isomerase